MIVPSIEQILYGNFIKYNRMQEMTSQAFGYSDSDTINLYIDMYSLVLPLYRGKVSINHYSGITSSIINLCAHMRDYFRTRHHVKTNIFIIFSRNCPFYSAQFYPDYNSKFQATIGSNEQITKLIDNNINMLKAICPYLPDIYFIEDIFEVGVVINDLICKQQTAEKSNTAPNLILSKDPYMYQLPAIRSDTVIYRCHKSEGEDVSWYVNSSNVYDVYRKILKVKNTDNHIMHPSLFSLLLAFAGVPARNIHSIYNINKASNIIELGIQNLKIRNVYSADIDYITETLEYDKSRVSPIAISSRFKALDILYQSQIYLNNPRSHSNMESVINLHDPNTVRSINDEYFRDNPLDLNRL